MKRSVIGMVFVIGLAPHEYLARAATTEAPATYAGNEVCQACHTPAFEKFSATVMGKIFLFNPVTRARREHAQIATARDVRRDQRRLDDLTLMSGMLVSGNESQLEGTIG